MLAGADGTAPRLLSPGRAEGLKDALRDLTAAYFAAGETQKVLVVAAGDEIVTSLGAADSACRFVPIALLEHAGASILSAPVRLDDPAPLYTQLEQLPRDGLVFATFELDGFTSFQREVVTRELAVRLPDLACRVADRGIAVQPEGLTPWVSVQRRRARCWLFLGQPGSGKTSAAIDFGLRTGLKVYHGDLLIQRIALGEWPAEHGLQVLADLGYRSGSLAGAIQAIHDRDLFGGLADSLVADAAGADFCLETWAPRGRWAQIARAFTERGYHCFAPGLDLPAPTVTKR